jgi:hypothetical protein
LVPCPHFLACPVWLSPSFRRPVTCADASQRPRSPLRRRARPRSPAPCLRLPILPCIAPALACACQIERLAWRRAAAAVRPRSRPTTTRRRPKCQVLRRSDWQELRAKQRQEHTLTRWMRHKRRRRRGRSRPCRRQSARSVEPNSSASVVPEKSRGRSRPRQLTQKLSQQNESSTKMMQRRKQYGRGGAHSLKSMIHSGASQVRCAAPWPYTHACAHTRACAHTPVHSFLTLGCACTRPHTPRRAKTSASASSATATAAATASRSVRRLGSSRRLRPRLERSR